jgi:prepilin-type N-terminal cleavage/methylation domain-containing protein
MTKNKTPGFTLIELLIVIAILAILSIIVVINVNGAREKAYKSRAQSELVSIHSALEMYANDNNGNYPPDANRDIPPGIEQYLGPGEWPRAPWPGSVYDWDNWSAVSMSYDPKEQVYQISIRFCTAPGDCHFPNAPWAQNFDYYSAVYYCISGPCRSHNSQLADHQGYCVNCQ